jgi:hypothetical protein
MLIQLAGQFGEAELRPQMRAHETAGALPTSLCDSFEQTGIPLLGPAEVDPDLPVSWPARCRAIQKLAQADGAATLQLWRSAWLPPAATKLGSCGTAHSLVLVRDRQALSWPIRQHHRGECARARSSWTRPVHSHRLGRAGSGKPQCSRGSSRLGPTLGCDHSHRHRPGQPDLHQRLCTGAVQLRKGAIEPPSGGLHSGGDGHAGRGHGCHLHTRRLAGRVWRSSPVQ